MKAHDVKEEMQKMQDDLRNYTVAEQIELDGTKLFRKEFKALTLGEFIDLEHYVTHGEIEKLLAVLYRKKYGGGMVTINYEPYAQVNLDYRASEFLKFDASKVVRIWQEYVNYRNEIIDTYESLFEDPDDVDELTEDDVMTAEERKTMKAQQAHGQFVWESLIMFLCNDDITKWDQVTELPLILAFNITSYQKSQLKKL
jgi:hypothetical protein